MSPTRQGASLTRAEQKRKRNKSLWFRWRFHLSGLLILIPIVLTPFYIELMAVFRGDNGLGSHVIGTQTVGPWEVTLAEQFETPPRINGPAGYMKTFTAALCETCIPEVKAVYLRLGKPRSLRTAGALGFGSPYRMFLSIPVPENTAPNTELWLTVKDGTAPYTKPRGR